MTSAMGNATRQQLLSLHTRLEMKRRQALGSNAETANVVLESLRKSPLKLEHELRDSQSTRTASPIRKTYTKSKFMIREPPAIQDQPDMKTGAMTPRSAKLKRRREEAVDSNSVSPSPNPRKAPLARGILRPKNHESPVKRDAKQIPGPVKTENIYNNVDEDRDIGDAILRKKNLSSKSLPSLEKFAKKELKAIQPVEQHTASNDKLERVSEKSSGVRELQDQHLAELEKLRAAHSVEIISWKARLSGRDSEMKVLKTALQNSEERNQASDRILDETVVRVQKELHEKYQKKHHERVAALKAELSGKNEQLEADYENMKIENESLVDNVRVLEEEIEVISRERDEEIQMKDNDIQDLKRLLEEHTRVIDQLNKTNQDQLAAQNSLTDHYEKQLEEKDKQLEELLETFSRYEELRGSFEQAQTSPGNY